MIAPDPHSPLTRKLIADGFHPQMHARSVAETDALNADLLAAVKDLRRAYAAAAMGQMASDKIAQRLAKADALIARCDGAGSKRDAA